MDLEFEKQIFASLISDMADVLLISEKEKDYQDMLEYGFKRVDYFNSYMIAEEYFKNHEKQLDSYDLILIGDIWAKKACCFFCNDFLEINFLHQRFCNLENADKRHCRIYENDHIVTDVFYRFLKNIPKSTYNQLTDYLNSKESKPIKTTLPTVSKKPLPACKSDLKILFLGFPIGAIKNALTELELNANIYADNNFALGNYVVRDLGKYDIIVTTYVYSKNVLNLLEETKKQQERTGQSLTMLCAYREDVIYSSSQGTFSQYPDKFSINYNFVGNNTMGKVIFGTKTSNYEECTKALIEGILSIYNKELKKLNRTGLQDYDLRTMEQINKDYEKLLQQEKEEGLILDTACNSYEYLIKAVRALIYQHIYNFDNAEIFSNKEQKEVTINMQYNNRTISSITVPYYFNDDKVFSIQRLSNKGKLLPSEKVIVYSNAYTMQDLPRKATIEELKIFNNIAKKVIDKVQELPKERPYERKRQKRRY